MKKLIMAFAAVALAGIANAATCNWNSANLYVAANADGGWATGNANLISAKKVEVILSLYTVDSTTYASLSGKSQKELYEAYSSATPKATGTSITTNPSTGAQIFRGITSISDTSADEAAMYGVLIATYHDATYDKDFYMATTAQSTYNSATKIGTAASLFSGVANASAGWQSVPEPTSGLLMLLGMAGLALRRKRA